MWSIIIGLAEKKEVGLLNFTNPGTISINQILELYRDNVEPNHKWEVGPPSTDRPACELDVSRLAKFCNENNYRLPTVREAIQDIFKNWKN